MATQRHLRRVRHPVRAQNTQSFSGCLIWMGALFENGYGAFWWKGNNIRAHRWSYIAQYGSLPDDLVLDHKCRVRSCVNPHHLEAVTVGENIRRGETGQKFGRRTHCSRGHLYDEQNTNRAQGYRRCRACWRERHVKRKQRLAQTRADAADQDRVSTAALYRDDKTVPLGSLGGGSLDTPSPVPAAQLSLFP